MTNIELLQTRAVELIIELLEDATLIDDDNSSIRSKLRYDLAVGWQSYANDIHLLFRELYFRTVVIKLYEVGGDFPLEEEGVQFSAEDLLTDFTAIYDFTENHFIAPVILFSADFLDWQDVASACIESFFHPSLLGPFEDPDAAVIYYQRQLDTQCLIAESGDFIDGVHYQDE
jgi:hypothetical protein